MHVTFIWTLNTCKLFKLKAQLSLFCSSGYSWTVCVQASLKYLRKIFLFIFISTTMSYGVCQLGFLELTKDENDWLEAHPIDGDVALSKAYFVIFLGFLTQETVPGFWIHTAATPLTLIELWGKCGHPKTTIVLLLSNISEHIICVGNSTGLWSLWIFFSQKDQERFQCWGYEVSKVMLLIWKDAFPECTDQKRG